MKFSHVMLRSLSFMKPFDNPSLSFINPLNKYLLDAHAIPMLTWESIVNIVDLYPPFMVLRV